MTVDRTTTDGDKLRLLADWFDRRDSQKAEAFAAGILTEPPDLSQEVQTDLRRMADALDAADHLAEMCRWVAEREPWVTVDPEGRRYRVEVDDDPLRGGCICPRPEPAGVDGYVWEIDPACTYHAYALTHPWDHRSPWNCPTFHDGCNCDSPSRMVPARLVPLDPEETP